jgi:hypothetical protein
MNVIPPETDVGIDENYSVSIDGSLISNPLDIDENGKLFSPVAALELTAQRATAVGNSATAEVQAVPVRDRSNRQSVIPDVPHRHRASVISPRTGDISPSAGSSDSNPLPQWSSPVISRPTDAPLGSILFPEPTNETPPQLGGAGSPNTGSDPASEQDSSAVQPPDRSGSDPTDPGKEPDPSTELEPGIDLPLTQDPTTPLSPIAVPESTDLAPSQPLDLPSPSPVADDPTYHAVPESGPTVFFCAASFILLAAINMRRKPSVS